MKPWELSEEAIARALRRTCEVCGAKPDQECLTPSGGLLNDSVRSQPVHDDRTR